MPRQLRFGIQLLMGVFMRAPSRFSFLCSLVVALLPGCGSQQNGGTRTMGGSGGGGGTDTAGTNSMSGGSTNGPLGGNTGVSGGISIGGMANECANANPPPECTHTADPGCGDGKINQASEQCDDGNSIPGDGCSGTCQLEPRSVCPEPGKPCQSTVVCGDSKVDPGEACDDGNKTAGDGCSATCNLIEAGFSCRTPGQPCVHVYACGDGKPDPNEGCDDGNSMNGDGCDSRCRIETGFKCDGTPSKCSPTKCGDGKAEGAESCDDGNLIDLDGCSSTCQAEPKCPTTGPCTSGCGDGILLNEECDDGNVRNGDGCSSTCKIEQGFMCNNDAPCVQIDGKCTLTVPVVYRDFNASGTTNGHPDFQPGVQSGFAVAKGLVQATWDADKKPVFSGKGTCIDDKGASSACASPPAFIHSTSSFAQWYRDDKPSSGPIPAKMTLWDNGKGGFVNRFGANGEPLRSFPRGTVNGVVYPNPTWCSSTDCTDPGCATVPAGQVCLDDCAATDMNACFATPVDWDGNPLFFPLDPPHAGILDDGRRGAKLPAQYGFDGWPWEKAAGPAIGLKASGVACVTGDNATSSGWCHNFSFTTEVKYWFKYDATKTARLDFTGDDDVWVFVNGKLAVDLGGWHVPLDGGVTIDKTTAATYGLEDGKVYMIGVFQAERETEGSSFRLTLAGFNMAKSDCHTNCGDGVIAAGEECDDGPGNTGEYNHCSASCTVGPRCGDGIKQEQYGEQCDDGTNDGGYGHCTADCKAGLHCGDGIVTMPNEQCDDGKNDGSYGTCTSVCKLAPHCGDGKFDAQFEQCDDGNLDNGDGCNAACKIEVPK